MSLPQANRLTVPAGIRDNTSQILLDLIEARFSAIPVGKIITYLLEHTEPSVLPALGWTFDVPSEAWANASAAGRLAILQDVLDKQRRRGVPGQVKRALSDTLDLASHIHKNPSLYADGSIYADGTFYADVEGQLLTYWIVVVGDPADDEADRIRRIAEDWARKSAHLTYVLFVQEESEFGSVENYIQEHSVRHMPLELGTDGFLELDEDGFLELAI